MNAGRDLDALVAEKVMGFVPIYTDSGTGQIVLLPPVEARIPGKAYGFLIGENVNKYVPHYSTSMDAAWAVVEKLGVQGFKFSLLQGLFEDNSPWRAHFLKDGPQSNGYADTAPHAICLAALKVCGLEVGQRPDRSRC